MKIKKNDIDMFYNKIFKHNSSGQLFIQNHTTVRCVSLEEFKKIFPNYKIPKDPQHPKYDMDGQVYCNDPTEKGKEYGKIPEHSGYVLGGGSYDLGLPWPDGELYVNSIHKLDPSPNNSLFFNSKTNNDDNIDNDDKKHKITMECKIS